MGDEPTYPNSSGFLAKDGWRSRIRSRLNRVLPPVSTATQDRLTSPLPGIILFLFLLGIAALSILLTRPPAPLPEGAAAYEFSAERAMSYVEALAVDPHPVGTPGHARAEAYLIAQLEKLGLKPQVQKTVSINSVVVEDVHNVVARLPGSETGGKALLLMAHYDSVAGAPGASDDASGVAALLETVRALMADGGALANDVILLFTDGEEQGMMGARAFVYQHPWAADVGVVINVDTFRTGPVSTQAKGPGNSWLISNYAQAVANPLANSLGPEIDKWIPGDGDSTPFNALGYLTLDIGAQGGAAYIHTAQDNVANVDLHSFQDLGRTTLALARQFGDADLAVAHPGDAVYFNAVGNHLLVRYPRAWIFPLIGLAALIWAGAVIFGVHRRQVSLRGVLLGTAASFLVALVLAGVGYGLWRLILIAYPQYDPANVDIGWDIYNSLYYWLAFMALGIGLAALLQTGARSRMRAEELAAGAMLVWLLLAMGISIAFPGASWVPTWALLFGTVAFWGWLALPGSRRRLWKLLWLAIFSAPVLTLAVPILYAGYQSLTIQLVWILTAALGLLAGLLALPLAVIAQPRKSWFPALMGIICVGFLVTGHLTSDNTPARPLRDGVIYALSADEGKAYWNGTFGTEVDPWTQQFLAKDGMLGDHRNIFPWEHEAMSYQASAPLVDLSLPQVERLSATGPETFRLHVTPTPGAAQIDLFTMPGPVEGTVFYVDGRAIESDGLLIYAAPPAEGFDVGISLPGSTSLTLRIVDIAYGLPAIPGVSYSPRPDWIIPNSSFEDLSAVAKTFTFAR